MPVTITVTADSAQAAANLQQFARVAEQSFNRTAGAATAMTTASNTFTSTAKSTHAGLQAIGRVAQVIGFQFMPQLTSSVTMGTFAIKDMTKAAAAAQISLGAMSVALAGLAIAGYAANEWWKLGSATLGRAQSETGLIAQNEALATAIHNVIEARRESGRLSAEEALVLERQLQAARQLNNARDAGAALASLSRTLTPESIDPKEFKALREQDKTDLEYKRVVSERLLLNASEETQLKIRRMDIDEAIARSEERRAFTGQMLSEGIINETEQRELELQDLTEILRLESERKQLGPDPNSWAEQWAAAANSMKASMGTLAQNLTTGAFSIMQQGFQGIGNSVAAIVTGAQTAGQAFAQLGRQLITQFISMVTTAILYATVAVPILTALGVLSGGATAATGAAVTTAAVSGAVSQVSAVAHREAGGPVEAGMPYIVGERRPELFVPATDGYILPSVPSRGTPGRSGSGEPANVRVYLVADLRDVVRREMESPAGAQVIVQTLNGRRLDLGLNT